MGRIISTSAEDTDLQFLKDNKVSVSSAIRAHVQRLKDYQQDLLNIENQRLLKNIQGMQNEIARLTSQVSTSRSDVTKK